MLRATPYARARPGASVECALLDQDPALVDADVLAALVHPGGAHVDDAAVRLAARLALVQHLARASQGVAGIDEAREGHVPIAEVRDGLLREVFHRHAEDH